MQRSARQEKRLCATGDVWRSCEITDNYERGLCSAQLWSNAYCLTQTEDLNVLLACLKTINEAQMLGVLGQLSVSEGDQLMYLIYAGLAQGQAPVSSVLLRWHEHAAATFGPGCILRTLTSQI